jgi:hypothetical protein
VAGAALTRAVTLFTGDTMARVGMWLSLPEGVRAARVSVSGSALAAGLVAPTAVRVHAADASLDGAPSWRGAALSGAVLDGARALVAEVRAPGRVAVIEVAGLARAPGDGSLTLRVAADGGGCLTQSIAVRVEAARAAERDLAGTYVAFAAEAGAQAARVARWADRVAGALAEAGAWCGPLRARASGERGASIEGAVTVSARGVEGDAWRAALRGAASGRVSWVELWSACDPDAVGLSVALGTRARPSPCEMSAWARTDGALDEALWGAAEHGREGTLQAVVGRWRDPVTPRVVTAWERGRGVRRFSAEAPWLGRFVRAPGARAGLRGEVREGDAVRACWPGPQSLGGGAA